MKRLFNKKISVFVYVVLLSISLIFLVDKKEAEAQLATFDGGNFLQNTLTAISSTASAASQYSVQIKEYVLDPLASGLAKQVVRTMTNSIVNWINSGFDGSPSFIQDPGAFFLDIADQATGKFISQNGLLSSLCSPFSIDIRIALAFRYQPRTQERYACTLSTIIGNSKGAIENASINGFTAGDFKQGGWPAFVSLTTEPQNNVYGAYLTAESDLAFQIATLKNEQRDELNQGRGFLSWKKCEKRTPSEGVDSSDADAVPDEVCTIQTPGSVIAGALETQLGSPVRQLELADELGEIVNALFAQLVVQTLQGGLGGLSQNTSSGTSYIDQTVSDLNTANTPEFTRNRTELLDNIELHKDNTIKYEENRNMAYDVLIEVKESYEEAKLCFEQKLPESDNDREEKFIQKNISGIDSAIEKYGISERAKELVALATEADYRLATLQGIEDKVKLAKTLNDLIEPSQEFSKLAQTRSLTDAKDVSDSKEKLDEVTKEMKAPRQDALRKLQECRRL